MTQYSFTPGGEIFVVLGLVVAHSVASSLRDELDDDCGDVLFLVGDSAQPRPDDSVSAASLGRGGHGAFGQRPIEHRPLGVRLLVGPQHVSKIIVRIRFTNADRRHHDEHSIDQLIAISSHELLRPQARRTAPAVINRPAERGPIRVRMRRLSAAEPAHHTVISCVHWGRQSWPRPRLITLSR